MIGAALGAVQACKPDPVRTDAEPSEPAILAQIVSKPPPIKYNPYTRPPRLFAPEPAEGEEESPPIASEPMKYKGESPWDRVHRVWMDNICKRCLRHKPSCTVRAAKLRNALLNICVSRREAEVHEHGRGPAQPEKQSARAINL